MTCRPCLDTYIHTYKQTINQYKQIVIIHKSIETYSYTYTWLQMVRPPQPTHRGGGGNIMCTCSIFVCRHKNNDMSTLLGHAHTYIPTDRQTHRHTYINQYKHIVIPIHGCICVTYPPFGGGGGGEPGGAGSYIYHYPTNSGFFANIGTLFDWRLLRLGIDPNGSADDALGSMQIGCADLAQNSQGF